MKRLIVFLFISVCFCNCRGKREPTVEFINLSENEFDAKQFKLPNGKMIDSLKRAHDSCMGISFDANAVLAGAKDNFFIGSILNKRSLKVVSTLSDLGLSPENLVAQYNMVTTPCYERKALQFPLKSILGENFNIKIPGADAAINTEINSLILTSKDEEMQTGSWIYLDLNATLKNILDTNKSAAALAYKKNLLDTSNIVLTAIESIMNVSFFIQTEKDMSEKLQAILKTKPSILPPNSRPQIKLFYISPYQFQLHIDGFFPVIGKFMKAELKS